MLKKISFTNFRGQTATHAVFPTSKIRGRTGGGKSTIKEAISFLFSGSDISGSRAPVHMISKGQDKLLVTIETEKATLERSLTQKKNSNFKLTRAGVSSVISQTDMAKMLGSPELFLSVFSSGYFLTLPDAKKEAVLHEILPVVDRYEILQSLVDFPLTDAHRGICKLNDKRADLCAAEVADQRRKLQSDHDQKVGRLEEIKRASDPGSPPSKPELEEAELLKQESLKSQWESFSKALTDVKIQKDMREAQIKRNKEVKDKRAQIESQLSGLVEVKITSPIEDIRKEKYAEVEKLKSDFGPINFPVPPSSQSLPDSERCPTCGQVVGAKHRESIKTLNDKAAAAYDAMRIAAEEKQAEFNSKLDSINKHYEEALERTRELLNHNVKVGAMRESLERELKGLVEGVVPDELKAPMPPQEEYDAIRERQLRSAVAGYDANLAIYKESLERFNQSKSSAAELAGEISCLEGAIARLHALERACKEVPQRELERQSELLAMRDYDLVLAPTIDLYEKKTGLPYSSLSDGEKIRAATHLSLKLNSLIKKKPINMVFIDNADLLDKAAWQDLIEYCVQSGVQLFFACVDEKAEKAYVENANF